MSATYSAANLLNPIVVALHHSVSPSWQGVCYAVAWSGARPSDPGDAPVGTQLTSSYGLTLTTLFSAPVAGVSQLTASKQSDNAVAASTIGFMRLKNLGELGTSDVSVGLAGSGAGCILDTLSTTVGVPITITNLNVKMPYGVGGTLKLNTAVVNQLVKMMTADAAGTALQMGVNGSILVYSGAAPADADTAATGTLLATIPTGAATPWNTTATAGACNLVSSISALASATGTPGYVRWTKDLYTIQGSVGLSAADFILDSMSLVGGVSVALTEATITLAAG